MSALLSWKPKTLTSRLLLSNGNVVIIVDLLCVLTFLLVLVAALLLLLLLIHSERVEVVLVCSMHSQHAHMLVGLPLRVQHRAVVNSSTLKRKLLVREL